eukprot:6198225-Pleurochrysis_carterae.AAC.4
MHGCNAARNGTSSGHRQIRRLIICVLVLVQFAHLEAVGTTSKEIQMLELGRARDIRKLTLSVSPTIVGTYALFERHAQ